MKRIYFLIPLLFCGCLAPDPGHRAKTGEAAQSNAAIHETRAPVQIDPKILINRTFGEAPILAEKVKNGELPAVSERLPENPLIVVPWTPSDNTVASCDAHSQATSSKQREPIKH